MIIETDLEGFLLKPKKEKNEKGKTQCWNFKSQKFLSSLQFGSSIQVPKSLGN